ncbi:MAG: hypothetical protein ACE5JI_21295 [Acidobacteriota bacterium]
MRNLKRRQYAAMSDADLIGMFKDLYEAVYFIDCFGTKDLIALNLAERELTRRGYAIRPSLPEIVKAGETGEDE